MIGSGIRVTFLVLGVVAAAGTATLTLGHQGNLAVKTGWLAALLLIIAADPTRFGPGLVRTIDGSHFFAIGFGILSAFFFAVLIALLVFVQLPHERIPHFDGQILALKGGPDGHLALEVEFVDQNGQHRQYVDTIAPQMYPNRRFSLGETVSVIVVDPLHPRIDEPAEVRWSAISWLLLASLSAAGLAARYWVQLGAKQP